MFPPDVADMVLGGVRPGARLVGLADRRESLLRQAELAEGAGPRGVEHGELVHLMPGQVGSTVRNLVRTTSWRVAAWRLVLCIAGCSAPCRG